KSLSSLLMDHSALGTIQVDSPQLHVVTRNNGSNLEDFLQPLLSKPPQKGALDVSWNVQNAHIELLVVNSNDKAPPDTVVEIPSLKGRFHRRAQQAFEANAELNILARDRRGHVQIDARATG